MACPFPTSLERRLAMVRFVSVCLAVSLLAACTDREASDAPPNDATATPTTERADADEGTATPVPAATEPASGARTVSEETDDFVFEYSYPAEAGNIPELAALLNRRLERTRSSLAAEAASGRSEARDNGFPYNKYSNAMEWKVMADLPGWLSLSGQMSSYTGGAHGIYGMRSLVWNKEAGEAIEGIDLFTSPQALGEALGERYCDALDKLRAERDAEPVQEGEAVYPACPPIDELTVLVGSSNGRTFDRLTLYAGPYVAGSYAEGAYEVNLDVDDAVVGAVKPEYRESFSARI